MKLLILFFAITLCILGWVLYDNASNPKLLPLMLVMGVGVTLLVVVPFTNNPISRWMDKEVRR